MSSSFLLSGCDSLLHANIFPPLELAAAASVGLLRLETYNSIPNVEAGVNNKFHFNFNNTSYTIGIPTGTYEISAIEKYLRSQLFYKSEELVLHLTPNHNTLKTLIKASFEVDFSQSHSIGPLLGFNKVILQANKTHISNNIIDINPVNSISVECNIVSGSYNNGKPSHTLHTFSPLVAPGYKIVETPSPVIYLPINTNYIDNISVRLVDQAGRLISFRKERITICLHIKEG